MLKTQIQSEHLPRFSKDTDGKIAIVSLDTTTYIKLTDKAFCPSGMERVADALARIRQIESDCIANNGEFDWEKLPEAFQDEYDGLCLLLDELQDDGEVITLEDYKQQSKEKHI